MQKFVSTPALTWLGHTLEVLALGAVVTGGITGYQTVASGDYSLTSIGSVVGMAILASLLKGGSATLLNNVNFPQALQDGFNELKALMAQQPVGMTVQATSASQTPSQIPHVVVQSSTGLNNNDIQAISQQLALNLANMAGSKTALVASSSTVPTVPTVQPYIDPLSISAKLPVYVPPMAIPDMATQQVPQVAFPAVQAPAMP